MRKQSIVLIFLFFIFQSVFAESTSDTLKNLLSNYQSYEANFTQVSYDNKNRAGKKSQGRVYMSRPGRFRWETTTPYQQTVIANNDTLWIYDADLKQASQQSLNKRGFNPAQLLTAPVDDLTQKFNVSSESDNWFKLTPVKTDRGFKSAYLQFRNGQLSGLKIVNQLNQVNVFSFSQIRTNPKLSAGLFNFKPSAGVKVIK